MTVPGVGKEREGDSLKGSHKGVFMSIIPAENQQVVGAFADPSDHCILRSSPGCARITARP